MRIWDLDIDLDLSDEKLDLDLLLKGCNTSPANRHRHGL